MPWYDYTICITATGIYLFQVAYKESYENFQKRFSKNLKQILKDKNLTQRKQVLAGLDPRYIARIKNGDINPTLITIHRICTVVGIDPADLFKK